MKVWLNGRLYDSGDAHIDVGDRGFTLGDGLFETVAVRCGVAQRLDKHLKRLSRGCEVLRLPPPPDALAGAIAAVLSANALQDAAVRITYTRGTGARGLPIPEICTPTLLVTAHPLPPSGEPLRCIVASVTRRNEYSPLSRIKSTNYLDNILAREEARQRGAGEALLLNTAGKVAEASAANIFIVKDGQVITPPAGDGALEGIVREEVIARTGAIERGISVAEILAAEEVFLSNSLGLRAVVAVDGSPVGAGGQGAVFRELAPRLV